MENYYEQLKSETLKPLWCCLYHANHSVNPQVGNELLSFTIFSPLWKQKHKPCKNSSLGINARYGDLKSKRNYYDFCAASHQIFTKCQALNLAVLKTHIMHVIHLPVLSMWTVSVLLSLLLFWGTYQGINPHTYIHLPHFSWRLEYYLAILLHSRYWWWHLFLNVHYCIKSFFGFLIFQLQEMSKWEFLMCGISILHTKKGKYFKSIL